MYGLSLPVVDSQLPATFSHIKNDVGYQGDGLYTMELDADGPGTITFTPHSELESYNSTDLKPSTLTAHDLNARALGSFCGDSQWNKWVAPYDMEKAIEALGVMPSGTSPQGTVTWVSNSYLSNFFYESRSTDI